MNLGIGILEYGFLALNLTIIVGWPVLALLTLLSLRRRNLTGTTLAVWVLIVVAVPYLGAIAYWLMRPDQLAAEASHNHPATGAK